MGIPTRIVLEPHNQNLKRYQCSVCSELLDNPHQDQCGHRLCLACYNERSSSNPCKHCEEEMTGEEFSYDPKYQPIPDYAIKKEMQKLKVGCLNDGCPWEDCLKHFQTHIEDCEFKRSIKIIECPICKIQVTEAGLENHIESDVADHMIKLLELKGGSDDSSDTLKRALLVLQAQMVAVFEKTKDLPRMLSLKDQLEEQTQRIIKLEALINDQNQRSEAAGNCDGTLIWRISKFSQKKRLADSGKQTKLYSPIFYTDRYGYKLCTQIYLNGDGMARDTHISLFLVLMKGNYDALLEWPFKFPISFSILDQSQSKNNHTSSFKPHPRSSSFLRPSTEMNIPSGLAHFLSLVKFQ